MRLQSIAATPFLALALTTLAACGGAEDSADDIADEPALNVVEDPAPLAADEPAPPAVEPTPPAEIAAIAAGDNPLAAVIEAHELAATYVSVLVDEDLLADPRGLEEIGRYHCEGRTGCRAMIWFSRSYLPLSLPVEARQTEAAVFGYGISAAGHELVQWNCDLFPEFEENELQCLPRTHRLL